MKLHPRLISSAARSLFGRFSHAPEHTLAPRALADGPHYRARDFEPSVVSDTAAPKTPITQPLFFWAVGMALASIYLIWFFTDLFAQTLR